MAKMEEGLQVLMLVLMLFLPILVAFAHVLVLWFGCRFMIPGGMPLCIAQPCGLYFVQFKCISLEQCLVLWSVDNEELIDSAPPRRMQP